MAEAWNDIDLLRAIADGDERALRVFYERHARWLAVRLRRSLPAFAVEDVLQETFLAVWRSSSGYTGQGDPAAWVWGIARRQSAQWQRRNGHPEVGIDEIPAGAALPGRSLVNDMLDRLDVVQALEASGPPGSPGRELAHRLFVEDQPVDEIARAMQIPAGTVKSRTHALRRRLRMALLEGDDA